MAASSSSFDWNEEGNRFINNFRVGVEIVCRGKPYTKVYDSLRLEWLEAVESWIRRQNLEKHPENACDFMRFLLRRLEEIDILLLQYFDPDLEEVPVHVFWTIKSMIRDISDWKVI